MDHCIGILARMLQLDRDKGRSAREWVGFNIWVHLSGGKTRPTLIPTNIYMVNWSQENLIKVHTHIYFRSQMC